MKLNKKGFTLVEVLAVVVILGIIMLIAIPNVNKLIMRNKKENCEAMKKNIINATKNYFSDYRYKISVNVAECKTREEANVISIDEEDLIDINTKNSIKTLIESSSITPETKSGYKIQSLITKQYLKVGDKFINQATGEEINKDNTYVTVKYVCNKKEYSFNVDSIDCGE